MRTLRRQRDPARRSQLKLVVALDDGEMPAAAEIVMLDGLGACFVLAVRETAAPEDGLQADELAVVLEVEAFAIGNEAPDIP